MTSTVEKHILDKYGGCSANDLINILGENDLSDEELNCFSHSKFYDSGEVHKVLSSHTNDFKLLSLNVQSLQSKFDSLISYLSHLESKELYFDVICLQETWLSEKHDISLYQIPGYQLISQETKCSSHGGLAIYLSDEYTFKSLPLNIISDIWEGMFLEITGDNLKRKITLGNVYRPPRFNNRNETIQNFTNELKPVLENIGNKNSDILITGDFNIDLLKTLERERFQDYLDLFMSNGLFPQITLPTRFARKSCSLIDQTFYKSTDNHQPTFSGIIISQISDHLPYFTCLEKKHKKSKNEKFIKVFNNSPSDIDYFCQEIQKNINSQSFDCNMLNDPNVNYTQFQKILIEAKVKCIPMKVQRANKYKHKLSPWITSGIIRSIKFRDNLYKKFKTMNSLSEEYVETEINLNTYNTILKRSIRSAKQHYYKFQFKKYKNDIRKTWSTIKLILNKTKKTSSFPNHFISDGRKVTNAEEIANKFNKYFTDIGPLLSQKININSSKSYKSFLSDEVAHSFEFEMVTEDHILNIIRKLKPKSSSGHDNISSILLKKISEYIAPTLAIIINQSLCTGIFPDELKIAQVKPLYKKDDPNVFDNYRPISLLPVISKVFEKVVYIQLYEYMVRNKLLYASQYGFRQEHSTELASLEFTDQVMHHLDNNEIPLTIFLDLSKAFDTLDHDILLDKLRYYGVKHASLNWFQSYLCNRYQYVDYNGTVSSKLPLSTGVPQGSILGPLMFIIYMNDIYKVSDKFHSILYADDTTLESPLCTFDTSALNHKYNVDMLSSNINFELSLIYEWLCLNKLSLNVKKTKFMLFHNRQRKIENITPTLSINGNEIERVTDFNFLGLTIDQHMSWNSHINKVSVKITKTLGILSRLKRFLPQDILLMIYNSLIMPHIQYGILCWGHKSGRILTLQKRAMRLITNSKYNAHTEPIYKRLTCLKIPDIYTLNILKLYYKIENDKVPHYFKNMFKQTTITHTHETRFRHLNTLQTARTSSGSYCIRYVLPTTIKNIPLCIKEKIMTHSLQGFSNYIKQFYIKNYENECKTENCYICGHLRQ